MDFHDLIILSWFKICCELVRSSPRKNVTLTRHNFIIPDFLRQNNKSVCYKQGPITPLTAGKPHLFSLQKAAVCHLEDGKYAPWILWWFWKYSGVKVVWTPFFYQIYKTRWWFQICFIFTPNWGRFPCINIFQMGWNHQPESYRKFISLKTDRNLQFSFSSTMCFFRPHMDTMVCSKKNTPTKWNKEIGGELLDVPWPPHFRVLRHGFFSIVSWQV